MRHCVAVVAVSTRVVAVLALASGAGTTTTTAVETPTVTALAKCQLCGRMGHVAIKCNKRFDVSFIEEERTASAAVLSYGIDTDRYADSGVNDHITGDVDKLTVREKYHGARSTPPAVQVRILAILVMLLYAPRLVIST